jgi:hypothetical protein
VNELRMILVMIVSVIRWVFVIYNRIFLKHVGEFCLPECAIFLLFCVFLLCQVPYVSQGMNCLYVNFFCKNLRINYPISSICLYNASLRHQLCPS